MIIKEKIRSEIEEQYKWNLSYIYESNDEWYQEFNQVSEELKKLDKYKGKIMKSAKTLYTLTILYFYLDRQITKLHQYAHLNNDADTTDNEYQVLYGKIRNLIKVFEEKSAYIEPELLKSSYSKVKAYYKKEPKLKAYDNYFKEIFRFKKHTLSEQEEKIFSSLANLFSTPSDIYSKLTDADMKIGIIKDEDGNDVELSDSNYSKYIGSRDRKVREQAFNTMYDGYKQMINTISSTMASEIDANKTIANLKNYDSAIQMSLYADNIDISVYNNLITTVNKHLPTLYKYYDLRKKTLKLDELHLYDIYAELITTKEINYPFNKGKELVLEALKPLGQDYIDHLTLAFDERWIDIYSNKGKRSGAYSSGSFDTKAYILLNYQEKLKDVGTLAHELGHSMHSEYSKENNPYQDSSYKIFVAEVASTVNELLLFKHMLKTSTDKEEKLTILNQLMELFKGTIYRQTMFAEFEKIISEQSEKDEILTPELLSNIYYDLNKKYFGENTVVDDKIRYEWSRIPHFYYFFYVYKYATGLSAACHIVNNILNNKENAVENYLEFLKSGSRDYPLEELKIAGVDMTDPKVIESAINMFDETIDEFTNLYNKK